MGALKPTHIAILLVVVLLLFGAKRLPDLAKSVGQSLKIFKKEMKELTEDDTPAPTVQVVTPEQGAAPQPVAPVDVTAAAPPHTQSGSTTPPQA